tara:strand:- start:42 stop:548 length:507 start_codon:yes stop_codon:yes gene_type:complete
MNNFDLTKYLATNPLLNEVLSNKEQAIVDDILKGMDLNIEESMLDVGKKMKQYAKKGLLSAAIVASVCGMVSCENNDEAISAINTELSFLDKDITTSEYQVNFFKNKTREFQEKADGPDTDPSSDYASADFYQSRANENLDLWEYHNEILKTYKNEKAKLKIQLDQLK